MVVQNNRIGFITEFIIQCYNLFELYVEGYELSKNNNISINAETHMGTLLNCKI